MIHRYKIIENVAMADGMFPQATAQNFNFEEEPVDSQEIAYLLKPEIHPYCFDYDNNSMYFLEVDGAIDHNRVSFFNDPLQRQARYIVKVSLDEVYTLEDKINITDGENILFVHHPGRTGSTLLHRVLGSHPLIESLSEDIVFDNIFFAECSVPYDEKLQIRLMKLLISLIHRKIINDSKKILSFKMTGLSRLFIDEVLLAFPKAKHIYLSRDPVKVAESAFNLRCLWPRYRFIWKTLGLRRFNIINYKIGFSKWQDQGTFEKYFAEGILNPKIKTIRRYNIFEGIILRTLLYDLVFHSIQDQDLICIDFEDILDPENCFEILKNHLNLDSTEGFDASVYKRHSQEGSRAKPKNMKKYYLTKREHRKLKEFVQYAISLMYCK